jgi:hypothetical protein
MKVQIVCPVYMALRDNGGCIPTRELLDLRQSKRDVYQLFQGHASSHGQLGRICLVCLDIHANGCTNRALRSTKETKPS